jgi:hypothetical protein
MPSADLTRTSPLDTLNRPRLVRMDTLRVGDRFTPHQGGHWTYLREDGALRGVHHAVRLDGYASTFAACAEVELGWLDRGWGR